MVYIFPVIQVDKWGIDQRHSAEDAWSGEDKRRIVFSVVEEGTRMRIEHTGKGERFLLSLWFSVAHLPLYWFVHYLLVQSSFTNEISSEELWRWTAPRVREAISFNACILIDYVD